MVFYRDLVGAAFDLTPEPMLVVLADELDAFAMPGSSVPGFRRRSLPRVRRRRGWTTPSPPSRRLACPSSSSSWTSCSP